MTKEAEIINNVIDHIKEHVGVIVEPCDYFVGILEYSDGRKYFNGILNERLIESNDYDKLLRMVGYSSFVLGIEPNGLDRVAIEIKV